MKMLDLLALIWFLVQLSSGAPWNRENDAYNLNQNPDGSDPSKYYASWPNHTYHPSPASWRMPFYTLMLDRFSDSNPSNNDVFETLYEFDPLQVHFRHGGDIGGLTDHLDYLVDLGIKGIYIAGTPYINKPWDYHSYNALDFTILDPHLGSIAEWRAAIQAAHDRGLYVLLDLTIGTLGDLLGFEGHINQTAPFNIDGYNVIYKSDRKYVDFRFNNTLDPDCQLPVLYDEKGYEINVTLPRGCHYSDFNQFGDVEAFGVHPTWKRQLSKFAGVQDRVKDWHPRVQPRLVAFACLLISSLDIDGFRIDKATQVTLEFLAKVWGPQVRECAASKGKNNFFIPGEITTKVNFGSLYVGRGIQSHNKAGLKADVLKRTNVTYMHETFGLDSSAFHYSMYRSLLSFLGVFGNINSDIPIDPVEAWNELYLGFDFVNAKTGNLDPRDMFGITNQDTFRWPSIHLGTERLRLGLFLTSLVIPGIPLFYFGDEQDLYLHDARSDDYVFGRQPMTSSLAWQMHGCFNLNASYQFFELPFTRARVGCNDDTQSMDHFNQASPSFLFVKQLFHALRDYPLLTDGLSVETLSQQTWNITVPTTKYVTNYTTVGIRSVVRGLVPGQGLSSPTMADKMWAIYSNVDKETSYENACSSTSSIKSPFPPGTLVKNILPPHQTFTVDGITGNACLSNLRLAPFEFLALVPQSQWIEQMPKIVNFSPGHDARILREESVAEGTMVLELELTFTNEMDCASVTNSVSVDAGTINRQSIICKSSTLNLGKAIPEGKWHWKAKWESIPDGVHVVMAGKGAMTSVGGRKIETAARFLVRLGHWKNVIVFPRQNYVTSQTFLEVANDASLLLTHQAVGADYYRYSLTYGKKWSKWTPYVPETRFHGSNFSSSDPAHVIVDYWCQKCGSAAHRVHAQIQDKGSLPDLTRTLPSLHVHGLFNLFGLDSGMRSAMSRTKNGNWSFHFMSAFPANVILDVWGDRSMYFGDLDGDHVLDRIPPDAQDILKITIPQPPKYFIGWTLLVNDRTLKWTLEPRGSWTASIIVFILFSTIPVLVACLMVYLFIRLFYACKVNTLGRIQYDPPRRLDKFWPFWKTTLTASSPPTDPVISPPTDPVIDTSQNTVLMVSARNTNEIAPAQLKLKSRSSSVLIATLEYEIPVWKIKVRIGGLGVIASLMARHITDKYLVWVIPKVGSVEYPPAQEQEPVIITLLERNYRVDVQMLQCGNIKYILLEAPIFRTRSPSEPYPLRMDDLEAATFYSCWNQCIASIIEREKVDIFHVNDYHCALAPLYLLPKTIPVALSIHNGEFQGLFPLRTEEERKNVCSIFNIPVEICVEYAQFGSTLNLLHAIVSYIRLHQNGTGAAGVSDKYGERCIQRYPAMWGLSKLESLPNPNPQDFGDNMLQPVKTDAPDEDRALRNKWLSQKWAGLNELPSAVLIVFVGRWSAQKGIDLIADLAPRILHRYQNVQMICVGPVIDLHGKLAAQKLDRVAKLFPGRLYSKPEFTAVPQHVFDACDFVLIPSRDEPFGLVAVEFGRSGALGIGAYVGGLGSMPGWWYPMESAEASHLLDQFWHAFQQALSSSWLTRKAMRLQSQKERFPVQEWLEKLDALYSKVLKHSGHRVLTKRQSISIELLKIRESLRFTGRSKLIRSGLPEMENPDAIRALRAHLHLSEAGANISHSFADGSREEHDSTDSRSSESEFNSIKASSSLEVDFTTFQVGSSSIQNLDDWRLHAVSDMDSASDTIHHVDSKLDMSGVMPRELMSPQDIADQKKVASLEEFSRYPEASIRVFEQFGDQTGNLSQSFEKQLGKLTVDNSVKSLCIEKTLKKAETEFFDQHRKKEADTYSRMYNLNPYLFNLMQAGFNSWPLYTLILSFGQLLGFSVFQLVLLDSDEENPSMNYFITGSVYILGTLFFWSLYRKFPSIVVLTTPFVLYTLSFILLLLRSSIPGLSLQIRFIMDRVALWLYSFTSASGAFYFVLNFGEEYSPSSQKTVFRAGVMECLRQLWTAGIWYWSKLPLTGNYIATAFISLLVILCAMSAFLLSSGLPECYRNMSPSMPYFWRSLFKRKLVIWFLVTETLVAFWLSGLYGRNWSFLWTQPLSPFATLGMVLFFYGPLWGLILWAFSKYSTRHPWVVCVFAVGLISPRWAQIMWTTSTLGTSLAWASSAGAYLSLGLFLWLALLDSIQQIGLSIMLLKTLTRVHVAGCLVCIQVLGSFAYMMSRISPVRPFEIFPNVGFWDWNEDGNLFTTWIFFWIVLACQVTGSLGYIFWFRKEQLARP